ncbi:hypothetical protein HK099_007175, partial [Clydaea vesicula]
RPSDMTPLSEAPVEVKEKKIYEFKNELKEEDRKKELLEQMVNSAQEENTKIWEDDVEGCASDEWDD